ncbi:MAG: tetratricopeptide repeat protein [Desulfovibrio sp.]|jgi:tetratricopeptide (TPR) repeat protein|nr:tetratricopeptide repeat protein [Desulfovibrio sp.]
MNNPDYEINKELGECYLFMGEYDKAHSYYTKAVTCNDSVAEPYMGLAAIAVSQGRLDDAHTLYAKANALEPGEKPLTGLGMIEVEQGKYAEAFANFSAALDYNPGNMMVVNSLLQLAHVLGRLPEIIPYLEAALDLGDTEAVRFALSACLLAVGREDEAKTHLEILIGEYPSNDNAKQLYAQLAA